MIFGFVFGVGVTLVAYYKGWLDSARTWVAGALVGAGGIVAWFDGMFEKLF